MTSGSSTRVVLQSDDFGGDWPIFESRAEAEAFIESESVVVARRDYCDGGAIGVYGPLKGVPIEEIIQSLRERNRDAIEPCDHPGFRVTQ